MLKLTPKPSLWLLMLLVLLSSLHLWAQPTDNPYRTFYGHHIEGHWTDTLPWQKVFNINDFPGSNYDQKFDTANKIISQLGGGVLYFPAGVYTFTNSIFPANGVILRGDNPPILAAKHSNFAPPSKLEFPEYIPTFTGNGTPNNTAFKQIRQQAHASNFGLVYLSINRATIRFTPVNSVTMPTPKGNTYWWAEQNRNIIIFGIRNNNVASPDAWVPNSKQHKWQRFSSRFAANIRAHAYENLVVSNNRINDSITDNFTMPGYIAKSPDDTTYVPVENYGDTAVFSYTDHYGIHVGRKSSPVWGVDPDIEPDIFRKGTEICDNWVYKTMRVGIHCGGLGLKVLRNEVHDTDGKKVVLHPNGQRIQTNYAATYENRGMDWTGWDVEVKHNYVEVKKHKIRNSNYSSVDGEGILFQECCGGTSINGITIDSNIMANGGGYIGIWKGKDLNNVHIGHNQLNGEHIYCTANTNGANFSLNNVVIEHNTGVNNIITNGTKGGINSYIQYNQGTGKITRPCHVVSQFNTGLSEDPCQTVPPYFPELQLTLPTQDTTVSDTAALLTIKTNTGVGSYANITLWQDITPLEGKTGANPTFSWPVPNQDGTYRLFIKGTEINTAQTVYSNFVTVTVQTGILNNVPKIALTLPTQDTTLSQGGGLITLQALTTHGNVSKLQFYNNGQMIGEINQSTGNISMNVPNQAGSFYVHAIGSNPQGQNTQSNVVKINVLAPSQVAATYYNGNQLKIYPNPATQQLNITTTQAGLYTLTNLSGQALQQWRLTKGANTIDISQLPKGYYLIRKNSDANLRPQKIIIY